MKLSLKKILTTGLVMSLMVVGVVAVMPTDAYAALGGTSVPIKRCTDTSFGLNATQTMDCGRCTATPSAVTYKAGGKNAAGVVVNAECWDATGNLWADDRYDASKLVGNIINVLLYVIGILCVIFIIWGAASYIMSRGDSKKVETAKNTILYAVIGLVLALIAWALVNWVFTLI